MIDVRGLISRLSSYATAGRGQFNPQNIICKEAADALAAQAAEIERLNATLNGAITSAANAETDAEIARGKLRYVIEERDKTFNLMLARATAAEAAKDRAWALYNHQSEARVAVTAERDAALAEIERLTRERDEVLACNRGLGRLNEACDARVTAAENRLNRFRAEAKAACASRGVRDHLTLTKEVAESDPDSDPAEAVISVAEQLIYAEHERATAAEAEAERLKRLTENLTERAAAARWNVTEDGSIVRVCRGEHDKVEACEAHEEVFVPLTRATAAEAEAERLRERIDAACEMAESFYHRPQGTLWNHGTTPSARDHAEWKGVKNTAQDLLYALDPDRALAAIDAALTERKP